VTEAVVSGIACVVVCLNHGRDGSIVVSSCAAFDIDGPATLALHCSKAAGSIEAMRLEHEKGAELILL
jgi:hypothetical protein